MATNRLASALQSGVGLDRVFDARPGSSFASADLSGGVRGYLSSSVIARHAAPQHGEFFVGQVKLGHLCFARPISSGAGGQSDTRGPKKLFAASHQIT